MWGNLLLTDLFFKALILWKKTAATRRNLEATQASRGLFVDCYSVTVGNYFPAEIAQKWLCWAGVGVECGEKVQHQAAFKATCLNEPWHSPQLLEGMASHGKANGIISYLPITLALVSMEGWEVIFRPGPRVAMIKYENNLETVSEISP